MSITPIKGSLPGEQVIHLAPENTADVSRWWLRRPNLFPGRTLTGPTLQGRQGWAAAHVALRGRSFTAGVVRGLEAALLADGGGLAGARVALMQGSGLAVGGEDVRLPQAVEFALADLSVVGDPSAFAGMGGTGGEEGGEGAELRAKVIGPRLGDLVAERPDAIARVGVLLLQPVSADRIGAFDPTDPCSLDGCGSGNVTSFEDWRIGDAARLLWYAWPAELDAFDLDVVLAAAPARWRNLLAWQVFDAERGLAAADALPWEAFGVPVGLVCCDAAWNPLFLDRASVVRTGGRARYSRMGGGAGGLATHWRLPGLWQAQFEQLAEQVAAAGDSAPPAATLAEGFARLPPFGLLPANVVDLGALRSDFFAAAFELDAVPIPLEQLDAAVAEAAALAPLDAALGGRVRVLVPVPQAVFEPRLLLREVIDPEFARTLAEFLAVRARWLGARQGLRTRASILARAISGKALAVPAIADDTEALEPESLAPWGPPPAGGGHRSPSRAGIHQHFFEGATGTMAVAAGETLFAWVYLDPDDPPRTLMLQWHAGTWEHRAYWGEDLLPWGDDGTPARARAGDLPPAGQWVQLTLPASLVGLDGETANGMSFALYDGQAAFGMTGAGAADGTQRKWFCGVLPTGAQQNGDERWEFLTHNDLWSPFEANTVILPADGSNAPGGGGHIEPAAAGLHQHAFENAGVTLTAAANERLYAWVYLDPNDPPTQLMLQWRTGTSWEHRAYWGLSRIDWGQEGTASRRRLGALPRPGRWVRLEIAPDAVGLAGAEINGMAFTFFDGTAAFGPSGALVPAGAAPETSREWFSGSLPPRATVYGIWQFLSEHDLRAPTSGGNEGQVDALARLYDDAALAPLSAQERYQLFQLGLEGFIAYLKARTDRADDLVDFNFVKVQTDIYRVRQLILGTTAATRLAVSPALAGIAQSETAVASTERIAGFFDELKKEAAAIQPRAMAASAAEPAARAVKLGADMAAVSGLGLAGATNLRTTTIAEPALIQTKAGITAKSTLGTGTTRDFFAEATLVQFPVTVGTFTPSDITNAAPLIGKADVRTTSIAERLAAPKATEAKDYTTSTRFEAVRGLLAFADELQAADGGEPAGLFEGVSFHGVRGDPALFFDKEEEVNNADRPLPSVDTEDPNQQAQLNTMRRSLPFSDLMAQRWRLPLMLRSPLRVKVDESAQFSDGADLADNTVALMRQLEGRIKLYRNAIAASQKLLDALRAGAAALELRLRAVGEELAEARHDVSVTRALIAEEEARLASINARRAQVLQQHVHFLAYQRPREAELIAAAPMRGLDPGLLEAPLPACFMEHLDAPDELRDLLAVVREAPARWFAGAPVLLDRLDRVDLLVKAVQSAQLRSQLMSLKVAAAAPVAVAAATALRGVAAGIAALQGRQLQTVQSLRAVATRVDPSLIAGLGWQGARAQAEEIVSLGDLIDGEHGRGDVAQKAAALFGDVSRIAACLHEGFSSVLPSIRLDWAERMSQFDEAPRLRNLASLPRWGEIDYADRRRMQAAADWLFGQMRAGVAEAESLMNDVVRMCLLLASHAPINRIVSGRLPAPVVAIPGVRIPIRVTEVLKLRVGMQALVYQADRVVARATVDDVGSAQVAATVIQADGNRVELAAETRVQFVDAASPAAMSAARIKSVAVR
ncbi:hypothetical protein [Thauera sinica]|uniref:Uncharacterized protein n=1 Tax=Thauera sinica TaxID=2665146 RepID=A0ABW1AP57_9RHOO|nr:hypothetical protein [Thauera sp. K11]ATE59884.1 hypothetical protein CCZ27_07910 [Thauera sp. K11]